MALKQAINDLKQLKKMIDSFPGNMSRKEKDEVSQMMESHQSLLVHVTKLE